MLCSSPRSSSRTEQILDGLDAADLRLLDLEVTGKNGADVGHRDALTRADVQRAADDLQRITRANVHLADAELVGVGGAPARERAPR